MNKNGVIIIPNKPHFSINDLLKYGENLEKYNKEKALRILIESTFKIKSGYILKDKVEEMLNNELWLKKYFEKNINICDAFCNVYKKGFQNLNYTNIISDVLIQTLKEVSKKFSELQDELFEANGIKNNIDKLVEYGFPISFETEEYVYEEILPKEEMIKKIMNYYTKDKINTINNFIKDKIKFDNNLLNYFEEAIISYDNKLYYSCASLLFSIMDRIISMNFVDSKGKAIGRNGSFLLKKFIEVKNLDRVYLNKTTLILLEKYFENANDFTLNEELLNRNMLSHGYMKRKIYDYECLQLLLVLNNLLFILNVETGKMINL